MPELQNNPAFLIWCLSLLILFLKMLLTSIIQGRARVKNNAFSNSEDAAYFSKGAECLPEDLPVVVQANKIWNNDLENIPIYLFLSLAFVLMGASPEAAILYFGIFTLARILHTVFYFMAKQPHRFVMYAIGMIMCLKIAVHTAMLMWFSYIG